MRSELNYAGKNLSEFGMWFDNSKVYKKPSKRFMGYDIPARNGTLYQSENKFNNVIIEFDCFIKDNFDQNYNDLVNYLNSFDTYQKLVNSYNGNIYRMALFHEAIEVDTGQFLKDGRFKLFFDCKPQEYYADGAEFERIASHYDTYTGDPAVLVNEGESTVTNLKVALNPQQNLNGYDSPWVGGSGKNKLPSRAVGSTTISGATFTVSADGTVTVNGTPTSNASFTLSNITINGGILNGCPSGGGWDKYVLAIDGGATDTGSSATVGNISNKSVYIFIRSGYTANNLVFKPMVRETGTSAEYEPYSNICPITGHTSASVTRTGKNLLQITNNVTNTYTHNGVTYTFARDSQGNLLSITADGTATGGNSFVVFSVLSNMQYLVGLGKPIKLSGAPNENGRARLQWWNYNGNGATAGDNGNGSSAFIPTSTAGNVAIQVSVNETVHNAVYKPMILLADETDITYEPYQSNTYTINLNGTRYGGTVDLATGVLTVTHKCYTASQTSDFMRNTETSYYVKPSIISDSLRNGNINIAQSDKFKSWSGESTTVGGIVFLNGGGAGRFNTVAPYNSISEMLTGIGGSMQIYYPLATPQTIQLTPQQISLLTGINYISSSGEITVTTSTPLILKNPSPMTAKPIFKFTNISAPFTVSANGETIISFQNAIRLVKGGIVNNMFFNATGTNLIMQKQGTPNYEETSFLINSGWLPAGRYYLATMPIGNLEVTSMDGTHLYSSGGTFTLTDITQVKVWYVITPNASTPQNFNFPIYLRPLGTLYVDSELMDCYMLDGDTAYSFNECVSLPKDFLQLDERTVVTMTSGAVGFIAPNWWRL